LIKPFDKINFEKIINNCFFYERAFAIYGGASGTFDLGPVGTSIQNNLINVWRKFFVINDRMHEVDCSILTPEIALKASGHLAKFSDIMVNDSKTNEPFRVDHLLKSEIKKLIISNEDPKKMEELETVLKKIINSELTSLESIDEIIMKYSIKSPKTGNSLNYPQPFNLMFKTQFGSNPNNKRYKECLSIINYSML
jgi:glycyl-tRNA synthetase